MVENGKYNVHSNHVFCGVNYWQYKCFMIILVVYYLFLILTYFCS